MKQIKQPVKIIDNFFEAPTLVRHSALKLEYVEQDFTIFPGLKSEQTIDNININFFDSILVKAIPHVLRKNKFKFLHCEYNLIDKKNNARTGELRKIEGQYNIAGYIFLDPEPVKDSGISFYTQTNGDLWPSLRIENIFNRCVIFDPMELHKIEQFVGEDKETSSLSINFYGSAE